MHLEAFKGVVTVSFLTFSKKVYSRQDSRVEDRNGKGKVCGHEKAVLSG